MRSTQPDSRGLREFLVGVVLGLVIWGLQMAGITVNLPLSALVLTIAFILIAYAFWIWEKPQAWRMLLRICTICIAAIIYFALIGNQLLSQWKRHSRDSQGITAQSPGISFPFVFGSPLGDNESPQWLMLVKHHGPSPTYNCDIIFYDLDRKNIEHLWLSRHPKSSFLPPNLKGGPSQISRHYAEIDPMGSPNNFRWAPLDINQQHYGASITTRSGDFSEKWDVTRVNGILRTRITVDQMVPKPGQSAGYVRVFGCSDPAFVAAPLASKLPMVWPPPLINPGWKPNHTFEVPTVIIDPNGNLEFLSIRSGNKTGLGCWSFLSST